jgi:hypothetical protein
MRSFNKRKQMKLIKALGFELTEVSFLKAPSPDDVVIFRIKPMQGSNYNGIAESIGAVLGCKVLFVSDDIDIVEVNTDERMQ